MKTNKQIFLVGALIIVLSSYQVKAQSNTDERERRKRPTVEQIFKDLDTNEDGQLSKKEVKGPLKKHFSKVDTNEDGYISREELENAPKPERQGPPKRNN